MNNDEREGSSCRSLVCDGNGIIIAEMVYRCMICAFISDSIGDAQRHYQVRHMEGDSQPSTSVKHEPIDFLDEEDDSDGNDANFSERGLVPDPNNFHDTSGHQEYDHDLGPDQAPAKSLQRRSLAPSYHQPTPNTFTSMANEKSK